MKRQKASPGGDKKKRGPEEELSTDLYGQPGHLIRRAHQISVSMFHAVIGPEVTPIQYGALRILQDHPDIDQVTLARLCALDNSTTASLAVRLEERGLLERVVPPENKRYRLLRLTPAGAELLEGLVPSVHELHDRLLESLTKEEQATFMDLLAKFVHLNNEKSRAPLRREGEEAAGA
jgi:DNA-binding MarR family transcriptional regulator